MRVTKLDLFKRLSKFDPITKKSRIVFTHEFVDDFKSLQLGNGGSWCRRSNCQNLKILTRKKNGKFNFLWNITNDEKSIIFNDFEKFPVSPGQSIELIQIVGEKPPELSRPIRSDIKRHFKDKPCCVCGKKSELVCDHKNDLYNDPRVLNIKTQTIDDFQSLCNSCNLQKRQICKKSKATNTRYPSTNIPSLVIFNTPFTSGSELLDPSDINAMKGTYWYDPVDFMNKLFKKLS